MKRTIVFAFTLVVIMLMAFPAQAHTVEELDEWRAAWNEQVLDEGLTPEAMDEWKDMRDRHGCDWPGTTCIIVLPHQHRTTNAPTTTTPPPSTNTAWGGNVEQWRPLVETYFQPADVPWAMRVMACESGGNPNAKNRTSTASGLFQFLRSTWDWVAEGLGFGTHASGAVFNPEQNVRAGAWLYYNGGPSHWVCK